MPPTPSQRLSARDRPPGFPVMKQRWSGLAFFHWAIDPDVIAARLPPGLRVDTFDGKAWIGVVPFFMQRIRPTGLPPLPWLSWFHELNVRTYVYDEKGNPGVWFFSLDCNQPIAVEIARRAFNLPYEHAAMSSVTGECITYRSRRKNSQLPEATFRYPPPRSPEPAAPESLKWFLVERYLLFSTDKRGSLHTGRVHHKPYLIETATGTECSTIPFSLNGFPEPACPPDSILLAGPVDVSVFPLRKS